MSLSQNIVDLLGFSSWQGMAKRSQVLRRRMHMKVGCWRLCLGLRRIEALRKGMRTEGRVHCCRVAGARRFQDLS